MTDLTSTEIAERRACTTSLILVHNTTYYSILTVFNGAMNMQSTTISSDGGKRNSRPRLRERVASSPGPFWFVNVAC